jgi:sugar lactone lactonase YvrE
VSTPTIRPERWTPPRAPRLQGRWAPTGSLDRVELWPVPGQGPEDVAVDADGHAYTALDDGRVLRFGPDGSGPEEVGRASGQVLGVEPMPDGRLLLCEADRGLVAMDPASGASEVLLSEVEGRRLVLTNNAAVQRDGTVLFSESSTRFPLEQFKLDLLEQSGTGSLWRFEPGSGRIDRLHTGLVFANGVTLASDERFALVAETGRYAIHRVWLVGDRAGQVEAFATNMPGLPDNLSTGPDGIFWCAMPSLRVRLLDLLAPRHPMLRRLAAAVPESLQPDAVTVAFVLGFDTDGRVIHSLHGEGSTYSWITGVREHDGWLYLSSLHGPQALARHRLAGPS